MLFLKPPFHIVHGVSVFADHELEDVFHFAPSMPHLTTLPDPATGRAIPQIQLLKFRGEAGSGGFLNFGVDLSVDEDRLGEVRTELKRIHGLRDNPIMSPVLFEDGAVKLLILGASSDDQGGDGERRFVRKADHHSKPALYGANNAIFSVELDHEGVQLVEASMQGEMMPIGIVYSLDFFALRPAFRVKVTADWERVQTHFEETFSGNFLFSSVEVSKAIDKLVEERAILIEADTFLPEGEDDAGWIGNRDEALNDFKDMVLRTFFEPSVDPLRPERPGWGDETRTANQVGLLIATGGLGGTLSLNYRKIDLTRIDRKSISLEMNERITVRRSIYPQAHLSGLFQLLRDAQGAIDMSRFVTEVTLDDEWFRRRSVTAHALVDFDADQVEAMNVTMRYGGRTETVRLTKATPSVARSWASIVTDRIMQREVSYDYSVSFRNVDVAERPARIEAPQRVTVRDELEIAPQNDRLYFVDRIQIGAAAFPFDRYPSVELHLSYEDEANRIDLQDSFLLTQDKPEITWRRFRMDERNRAYKIRQIFHAADNRDREIDWTELDQERLTVRNPLPRTRTVQVVPAVPWQIVSFVFVELSYGDADNSIFQSETLFFMNTDKDRGPKTFTADMVDETKRFVGFSAQILMSDNRQVTIPRSDTQGSVIIIRPDMIGHRVIEVLSPAEDFAARGVRRLDVDLSYVDEQRSLSVADRLSFDAPGQTGFFEYNYADPARSAYRIQRTEILTNGMSRQRDLGFTVENPLRLRLG